MNDVFKFITRWAIPLVLIALSIVLMLRTGWTIPALILLSAALIWLTWAIIYELNGKKKTWYLYVFASWPAVLWLSAPLLLASVPRPATQTWLRIVGTLRNGFDSWFYWPLLLLFGLYVAYVIVGEEKKPKSATSGYAQVIAPRKSVWICFGFVVLVVTILSTGFMLHTSRQVRGLEPIAGHLVNEIEEIKDESQRLEGVVKSVVVCDDDAGKHYAVRTYTRGKPGRVNIGSEMHLVAIDSNCRLEAIDSNRSPVTIDSKSRGQFLNQLQISPHDVAPLEVQLGNLTSTRDKLTAKLSELEADQSGDTLIQGAQDKVKAVSDAVVAEQESVREAKNALTGNDAYNDAKKSDFGAKADAFETAVDDLAQKVDDAQALASGLSKDTAEDVKAKLEAAETARETAESTAAKLETAVTDVGTSLDTVKAEVTALKTQLSNLKGTIDEAVTEVQKVLDADEDLWLQQRKKALGQIDALAQSIEQNLVELKVLISSPTDTLQSVGKEIDDLIEGTDQEAEYVAGLRSLAGRIDDLALSLGDPASSAEVAGLETLAADMNKLAESAGESDSAIADSAKSLADRLDALIESLDLESPARLSLARERADEINDIAFVLQPTAAALTSNRTIPFMVVSILFVVFLLLPWWLYLSFITSKRANTVRDRRKMIKQLGLQRQFLDAPVTSLSDDQQTVAREVASYLLRASEQLGTDPKDPPSKERIRQATQSVEGAVEKLKENDGAVCKQSRALEHILDSLEHKVLPLLKPLLSSQNRDSSSSTTRKNPVSPLSQWAVRSGAMAQVSLEYVVPKVVEQDTGRRTQDARLAAELLKTLSDKASEVVIKQRRFHSREYVLPLLILTALSLVGWFYIIFPNTLIGLGNLILEGGSLKQLTEDLTKHFTAVTMTFAGAWLFITVMLINRWTQDDLYPRSYLYASLRLAIAILVGLVFAAWFDPAKGEGWKSILLIFAFAVGVAPLEFVRAVFRWIRNGVSDIWSGVSDIWSGVLGKALPGIAKEFKPPDWGSKHPLTILEDVTIWDEGRLYLEGVQNVHSLATADLVRIVLNTPFDPQQLVDWVDQAILFIHAKDLWRPGLTAVGIRTATDLFDFCLKKDKDTEEPDSAKIKQVERAFAHAQVASLGTGDPPYIAQNAVTKLQTDVKALGEKATEVKETAKSLDNIATLQSQVEDLVKEEDGKLATATTTRSAVLTALDTLGDDANTAKAGWQDDSDLANKLQEVQTELDKAKPVSDTSKVTRALLIAENADAIKALDDAKPALNKAAEVIADIQAEAESTETEGAEVQPGAVKQAKKTLTDEYDKSKVGIAKAKADALQESVAKLLEEAEKAKKAVYSLDSPTLEQVKAAWTEANSLAAAAKGTGDKLVVAVSEGGSSLQDAQTAATQIQTNINNAKTTVDSVDTASDVADAKAKVTTAVDAIKALPGSSESPSEGTVAKAVAAIAGTDAYMNWKTALDEADKTVNAVKELKTAIDAAKGTAEKLDSGNKATFDKVADLQSQLGEEDGLTAAVNSVETQRKDVLEKLKALSEQETYAVALARRALEKLEETQKAASETVKAAVEAASADSIDDAALKELEKKATDAVSKAEALKTEAESAAEKAIQAAVPILLTADILLIILEAMKRDPNIAHVRRFWRERHDEAARAT